MEKGLFLENWEIALLHDIVNYCYLEGYVKFNSKELDIFEKIDNHIKKVEREWKELE